MPMLRVNGGVGHRLRRMGMAPSANRTVYNEPSNSLLSSFEEYLGCDDDPPEERAAQENEHMERLAQFPHAVMLQLSYPELYFANRWCWQNFGPCDGECTQRYSEYPVCDLTQPHSHAGKWTTDWFVKTDYDFGFNEWYFAERADCERFLANVDTITWGEHYQ